MIRTRPRTFWSLLIWTTSYKAASSAIFENLNLSLVNTLVSTHFYIVAFEFCNQTKRSAIVPIFGFCLHYLPMRVQMSSDSHTVKTKIKIVTLYNWELFIILFTIRWCHHSLFISCTQTSTYFSHITIHYESTIKILIREIVKRSIQLRMHRSLILLECIFFFKKTMAEEYTVECQQDRIVISFDQQYLQGPGGQLL